MCVCVFVVVIVGIKHLRQALTDNSNCSTMSLEETDARFALPLSGMPVPYPTSVPQT